MTSLEKILAIITKHYQQWEEDSSRMDNGYQFESTFASMTQKMEREILKASLKKIPKSRNSFKKKHYPIWKNRRSKKACSNTNYKY